MYQFLNIFFTVFHTGLILFNLFGWIWKKTRFLHFITISITLFSWIVLGIWYGFGYCPCTDWHWIVRRELGITDMPQSYIKFLIDQLTGIEFNVLLVDSATVLFTALAFAASVYVNFFQGEDNV